MQTSSAVLLGSSKRTTTLSASANNLQRHHGPYIAEMLSLMAAGVDSDSFVNNVMPKLDSAASEHVVWSEKFLDNYVPLDEALTATWGCSVKTARAIGKGTLILSAWPPDGSRSTLVLHDVLNIPAVY